MNTDRQQRRCAPSFRAGYAPQYHVARGADGNRPTGNTADAGVTAPTRAAERGIRASGTEGKRKIIDQY
jgi:hypothetical protein